jgi:hypothetical protein
VSGAKGSDELRVAVKCQTNPEIAGSPRNALTHSLGGSGPAVELLEGLGVPTRPEPAQTPNSGPLTPGVRRWGVSSIVEREATQTIG